VRSVAAFQRAALTGGRRDAHHVRREMRCYVRTPIHMQTPLLLSGEPRERFAPAFGVVAHERIELFTSAKDGTEAGRHNGPRVHRALEHALMHRRFTRDPIVIVGIPLPRIDVANDERKISVRNRRRGFTVDDEAPARQFRRHDAEQLNG